jgi:hypothetical protein
MIVGCGKCVQVTARTAVIPVKLARRLATAHSFGNAHAIDVTIAENRGAGARMRRNAARPCSGPASGTNSFMQNPSTRVCTQLTVFHGTAKFRGRMARFTGRMGCGQVSEMEIGQHENRREGITAARLGSYRETEGAPGSLSNLGLGVDFFLFGLVWQVLVAIGLTVGMGAASRLAGRES